MYEKWCNFQPYFTALRAVRRARCASLRCSLRVPFQVHFGDHCWSIFQSLGSLWGAVGSFLNLFSVPGALWGALWAHFSNQKSAWGSKGAPRGATTKINYHIWAPFGDLFLNIFVYFAKKRGSEIGWCFSFIFLVTLSAPRDGLICNPYAPAQSKHTFACSTFF